MKKYLPWLILSAAFAVSASAAFYSVFGLSKLFSGAANNVIIMSSSLEIAKIITTAYLHEYWSNLQTSLKWYLTSAVIILAVITSGGIYGFLSDAYQQTAMKDKYHSEKTNLLSTKKSRFEIQLNDLKNEREGINSNIQILSKSLSTDNQSQTIDKRTGQVLTTIQSSKKTGVQNQLTSENQRRESLNSRIDKLSDSIQVYEIKIIEANASNNAASELGPLKYLSSLTGVSMDRVVNWFLILLIFVFDPLAITLVIASLRAFEINKQNITQKEEVSVGSEPGRPTGIVEPIVETELSEPEVAEEEKNSAELLRDYFATTPQEEIQKDWDAVKDLDFEGPTIDEFLESTVDSLPVSQEQITDLIFKDEKKKRGRPKGSKNRPKPNLFDEEKSDAVIKDSVEEPENRKILESQLTPEVAAHISEGLPKPKDKKKV